MLSGLAFVSKDKTERLLEEETVKKAKAKSEKKEKRKKEKKEKKPHKHGAEHARERHPSGSPNGHDELSPVRVNVTGDPTQIEPTGLATTPTHSDDEARAASDRGAAGAEVPGHAADDGRESWMKGAAGPDADALGSIFGKAEPRKRPSDLPAKDKVAVEVKPGLTVMGSKAEAGSSGGPSQPDAAEVGDGGASWRLKALKRAQERAAAEGRDLDDEVKARHASVGALAGSILGAPVAGGLAHLQAARARQAARTGPGAGAGAREARPRSYLEAERGPEAQMRRARDPHADIHRSFSRKALAAAEGPGRDSPSEGRRREADGGSDGRHADGGGHRRRGPRDEDGAEPASLDRGRQTQGAAARDDGRSARDGRGAELASNGARRAHERSRAGGPGRGGAHRSKLSADDSAALASAHVSMNRFQDDGSFMQRFEGDREFVKRVDAQERELATETREAGETLGYAAADAAEARQEGGVAAGAAAASAPERPALGGNFGAAAALRARLTGKPAPAAQHEPSVLVTVDAQGRAMRGSHGREAAGLRTAVGNEGKRKLQRYDGGEKVRYFADDGAVDLATLVKRARHDDDAHDMDAALAHNIARKARFKGTELDAEDEYDYDGGLEMYEDRSRKGSREQQQRRAEQAVVTETKRLGDALGKCALCFGSRAYRSELTVSIGQHTYLALPAKGRLVPGHCIIAPTEHAPSFRDVDENIFEELKNFKKCLIRMFEQQGKKCIFLETATQVKALQTHALVECVPVDDAAFAQAPLMFKQEIGESESEWSQHHAKRLMDTTVKGLRGCIPTRFPYFHVEFGYKTGFVHVIDDEAKWKPNFGRSVMAGLLKLRDEELHRRAMREGDKVQQHWKAEFQTWWKDHDWTEQLDV